VTVKSSGRAVDLPIALVDDQTVTVPISIGTEKTDALVEQFDNWRREVVDAYLVQVAVFKDLGDMAVRADTQREKVVEQAEGALKRMSDDYDRLALAKQQLPAEVPNRKKEMTDLDGLMEKLKAGVDQLKTFTDKQEKILKEETRPERKTARAQLADAALAEQRADFDKAIELYKKGLAVINDPDGKKHLEKLETQWMPRDDEHIRARKFVYETWPGLDTAGLDREMDTARKALQVFKSAGDYLSPRKLVLVTTTQLTKLKKESSELKPQINEDDHAAAERIQKVVPPLQKLLEDTVAFLKTASPEG